MITERINIDVRPGGVPIVVHVTQYEVGLRTFEFVPFTSSGEWTDVTGSATLEGTKPDGNAFQQACTYVDGIVTYVLHEQLCAVSGRVWSRLVIRNIDGDMIGMTAIVWDVGEAGVKDDAVMSDSDISALRQFLDEFGTIDAYRGALNGALAAVGGPLVAATASAMTDTTKVYVYTGSESGYTEGHWYYWNGSAWTDGGVYQSTGINTDKTLTVEDMAADAKAAGDAVAELKNDITDKMSYMQQGYLLIDDIEQGTTSSGNPVASTTRLRTASKIEVKSGDKIKFVEGTIIHNIICQLYNTNGTWTGEWSGWKTSSETVLNFNGFIRIVWRKDSGNSTVTVSDYDATTTIIRDINNIDGVANGLSDAVNVYDSVLKIETINPTNMINPDALTAGRYIYNGTFDSSASYRTTDYIPVNNGDLLRFYKKTVSEDYGNIAERTTGERLALFDASKSYLGVSGQYPVKPSNGYTVDNPSAKYIRLSYELSLGDVELTINQPVKYYEEYILPYDDSARINSIEKIIRAEYKQIIDCWGDSRTEMSTGTSYTDYLADLLGDGYVVTNHGLSGQSIGEVAFRYGGNEVFVTLEGNAVPASGTVNITNIYCSVGSPEGYNMETADSNKGSRCSINGVFGTLVYQRNGDKKFTRDASGIAVNVKPMTKLMPIGYFDPSHMQILWGGKNDFAYGYPYIVSGIEDNYNAMVAKLPHERFIILGETYSASYTEGTASRERVDTINEYLFNKYPNNFINIQDELISHGLTLENITATEQDETDIANGFIPSSLMADAVHPNQYGREAIAKIIYAWMQEKEWV